MATERSVVIFSQGTYGLPCTMMKNVFADQDEYMGFAVSHSVE